MKIKLKNLKAVSLIYIYINIFIFFAGWLKPIFAVIACAAAAAVLFFTLRKPDDRSFVINKGVFVFSCVVIPFCMLVSGHCGIFKQTADWCGRNALLNDITSFSWPVYYSDDSALTYYLAHFLFPALIGKLTGIMGAKITLWLYTSFGLGLAYLYLVKISKADSAKKQLFVLLMLLCFGNFEDLKVIVTNGAVGIIKLFNASYSKPNIMIGYTPFMHLYATVFNQVIMPFIALGMLFDDDSRVDELAVTGVPMILYAPFPLVSFFCIALAAVIKYAYRNRADWKTVIKSVLSWQNIIAAAVLAPIFIMYFYGNITADKPTNMQFHFIDYSKSFYIYAIFVITDFLVYSVCIFKKFRRDIYFYTANITLLVLPLMQMGLYNDLCTRSSIVGLYVLMLCVIRFLFDKDRKAAPIKMKYILSLIVILVCCKSVDYVISTTITTSEAFANQSISGMEYMPYKSMEDAKKSNKADYKYNFYTFDAKEHFFFKYIAK